MGDALTEAPVFSRGSTVLDYWLVHAEGLTVEPLGARVEEVVVAAPEGRAERLIVRSRMTRRRRTIAAEAIAAVEPAAGTLLLDAAETDARPRAARARVVGAASSARAGTAAAAAWARPHAVRTGTVVALHGRSAASWARPRAARTATATARYCRSAGAHTARGVAWLTPRVVAATRTAIATAGSLVLAGAIVVARGTARAARRVEGAAERRRRPEP